MLKTDGVRRRIRKNFGKIEKIIEPPNLIDMQKNSYKRFLQKDVPPEEREEIGLQAAFKGVFPIHDFAGTSSLEFVKYMFEDVKHSEEECLSKGMTYEAPLRLTVRLVVFDADAGVESRSIRDIKEQEIYFGTVPMMTDRGTFIINGTERAVVSQLHRSPGAFFDHDKGKTHSSGKLLYSARIIPLRGSWLDFEFDPKDFLHVRIDRRRKFPATILLRALGYSDKEILHHFYETEMLSLGETGGWRECRPEQLAQEKVSQDIVDPDTGEVLAKKGAKYSRRLLKVLRSYDISRPRIPFCIPLASNLKGTEGFIVSGDVIAPESEEVLAHDGQPLTRELIDLLKEKGIQEIKCLDPERIRIPVDEEAIEGRVMAQDVLDPETGEVILEVNQPIVGDALDVLRARGMTVLEVLVLTGQGVSTSIRETLLADRINSPDEAILDIYRKMRPSSPPTQEVAESFFDKLFFNLDTYDLSKVGRLKLNYRLNLDVPLDERTLQREDILAVVKELVRLKSFESAVDDIDNLGNRRVRAVGELLENQYRIGLVRIERAIFGDKAGDVKDTSMKAPPGVSGIVIDAKVFSRGGVEKDERSLAIEAQEAQQLRKDLEDEVDGIVRSARENLARILPGKKLKADMRDKKTGDILLRAKHRITAEHIEDLPVEAWAGADFKASMDEIERIEAIVQNCVSKIAHVTEVCEEKIENLGIGDELAPGVIKMVKVFVAVKRKLSVGDKMAGRHGNKGVLSRILPVEDMPYFADGTAVDIVLNPLGVPSRMNVGQVLETHLGWASYELGRQIGQLVEKLASGHELREKLARVLSGKEYGAYVEDVPDDELAERARLLAEGLPVATPVFDGADEEEIKRFLDEAGLPITGQTTLYDGRTGEPFDQQITVGMMYIMKLHHLVDDKLHARSIGPYSLVTQQPLGGKAQFGGQRLGEMEVWAMEAYGAAYTLQEFLTVKSDDVAGRTRMYERIVKGNNTLEAGLPESFKVLMKELQGLALEIELFEDSQI